MLRISDLPGREAGRWIVKELHGESTTPAYGESGYCTHRGFFTIVKVDGIWRVNLTGLGSLHYPKVVSPFLQSNIAHVEFPRRIDAVKSLETFIQSVPAEHQEAETS